MNDHKRNVSEVIGCVTVMDPPDLLWSPKNIDQTQIFSFMKYIEDKYNIIFDCKYDLLYNWSVKCYNLFWMEIWNYFSIKYSEPYDSVIDDSLTIDKIPKWFIGSKLNFAENILNIQTNKCAIISYNEHGHYKEQLTYFQLFESVRNLSASLEEIELLPSDILCCGFSNRIETIQLFLACASIGVIWNAISSDFQVNAMVDRMKQINPKIYLINDMIFYKGKYHMQLSKLRIILTEITSITRVYILKSIPEDHMMYKKCCEEMDYLLTNFPNKIFFYDNLMKNKTTNNEEFTFKQLPFDHPLIISYTSGTSGPPKCLVHSSGGVLLKHIVEHCLHTNLNKEDNFLFLTMTGWMMWIWMLSSLYTGCTLIIYDGSPLKPSLDHIWDIIEDNNVSVFGLSPPYLQILQSTNYVPKVNRQFNNLRTILSTGSCLSDHLYDFVFNNIKKDVLLGSISGGTDIMGCFCGQNVLLPVYRGRVQSRQLAMAVECWGENGNILFDEPGHLVCTKPFPSMPIFFYNDQDSAIYHSSYFKKFEGIWYHGDYMIIFSNNNTIKMLGRSDGTLNPNGIRFGSSEIYSVVETIPWIDDSICIGVQNPELRNQEQVILFIKLRSNLEKNIEECIVKKDNKSLADHINSYIHSHLSPRHGIDKVIIVQSIPYTLTGKKMEIPLKKIISAKLNGYESNQKVAELSYFENLRIQDFI